MARTRKRRQPKTIKITGVSCYLFGTNPMRTGLLYHLEGGGQFFLQMTQPETADLQRMLAEAQQKMIEKKIQLEKEEQDGLLKNLEQIAIGQPGIKDPALLDGALPGEPNPKTDTGEIVADGNIAKDRGTPDPRPVEQHAEAGNLDSVHSKEAGRDVPVA